MNSNYSPRSPPAIKIKGFKSEIKVHRGITETVKLSPELNLIKEHLNQKSQSNDKDKVNQAWDKLKNNALSKAIAMSPEIAECTLGPKTVDPGNESSDTIDCGALDLKNAVTSTPCKPKCDKSSSKLHSGSTVTDSSKTEDLTFNVSAINGGCSPVKDDIKELNWYREKTIEKIEGQIRKSAEQKKIDIMKKLHDHDEKIKVNLEKRRLELDKERLIQMQQQYDEAERQIRESKQSAQVKADHLQQSKQDHGKKLVETSEKIKQVEQMRKLLEEKQKQERKEYSHRCKRIHELQVLYIEKYKQITEVLRSCKDQRKLTAIIAEDIKRLKKMNENFKILVDKCGVEGKTLTLTSEDVTRAEHLYNNIVVICNVFSNHSDQINLSFENAEESKKKEQVERELREQEEAQKQQKDKEAQEEVKKEEDVKRSETVTQLTTGIEDCISEECFKMHLELSTYLEDYERQLQPLLKDESLRKFVFDCQKAVNLPVNAISPYDDLHLGDKLYRLTRLLQGQPVSLGDNKMFLVTGHPLGVPYCTNLLAKKFVKQGELMVSNKPDMTFAIAAVVVALWAQFPTLGRLLLAHFCRECPYLLPAFLPQLEGQTDEDYYRTLGYQYKEGKVEAQDKFLRRMSGIMRLYSAILITPLKRSLVEEGRRHPHSMRQAWRWLAAMLNLRPRPDISATLIFDFLEVTGNEFFRTYGVQFTKLLIVLCVDVFPVIEQITPDSLKGPVTRLKSFLEKTVKEGQVPPPAGLLPPNFW